MERKNIPAKKLLVLLLSLLFSWSFVKTRSIAVPIVLHVVYDLIVTMIG